MAKKKTAEDRPTEGAEDAPSEETDVGQAASIEKPRKGRPTASVGNDPEREAGPDLGISLAPVKFAIHALFYSAGKVADAGVSLYSKACRLDRRYFADFSKATGIAHARKGRWEKAIPLLEKALAADPDDLATRMCLAEACDAAGQDEKAQMHYEKALEADPDSVPAMRALGLICLHREDYDQAIEYLEKAVQIGPDHAESFYRLGMAYDNKERYGQAVKAFKKAIAVDPRAARTYQALGFTYESMGDRESAVKCFKKALEF